MNDRDDEITFTVTIKPREIGVWAWSDRSEHNSAWLKELLTNEESAPRRVKAMQGVKAEITVEQIYRES